jgi:hypothetical protein
MPERCGGIVLQIAHDGPVLSPLEAMVGDEDDVSMPAFGLLDEPSQDAIDLRRTSPLPSRTPEVLGCDIRPAGGWYRARRRPISSVPKK